MHRHYDLNFSPEPLPLRLRVNRRARRITLSVNPVEGYVNATIPAATLTNEAIAFAHEKRDWILEQLSPNLRAAPFTENETIPFMGKDHLIVRQGGPRARIQIDESLASYEAQQNQMPKLIVGGDAQHINRRVVDWLKKQARLTFTERTDYYCERLNVTRGPVKIRDARTRWGSCSSTGTLSFTWRLMLCPPDIIDYVAAHECAHLIHMNHSPAFWRLLATLDVDARAATQWFHENGAALFRYGAERKETDTSDHEPMDMSEAALTV